MYHHIFSIITVIFVSLLFLLFYCSCFFVVLTNTSIIAYHFLLLLSLLLHGFYCDHYCRCQSRCWCYYYCSYYIVVTNIASLLCPFLWFFDFIKFKFTLNFCNYLFGSVALFYFILQGIK